MGLTTDKIKDLLTKITLAKVNAITKHENADRLQIVQLEVGDSENFNSYRNPQTNLVQVVTAANNFSEGDFVAYLAPGNIVPGWLITEGKEIKLESRKMRGEISHGMILAEDEIGIGTDHEGIMVLNSRVKEEVAGMSIFELLNENELQNAYAKAGIVEITEEMQKKIDLLTRDLAEVVGEEDIPGVLQKGPMKIYWGTAPTGKPHVGYFVPLIKIADFLKAGSEVTILIADLHAFLDNMKSTWELLEARTEFYQFLIKEMLKRVGVSIKNLKFVRGTDYQLGKEYTLDMYRAAALTSIRDAKKAGSEVVKQTDSPLMSSMLYPILQAIDEEYLGVDAQFGGVDQRKIFMFAREHLPKLGYKKRVHFMNPLIPGLGKSGKMSSSEPNSKIDLTDSDDVIREKISKAFSEDQVVEGNGLLAILKYIIFKVLENEKREFEVLRPEKWGGNISYKNYSDLEKDFVDGNLFSVDIKPALARELINLVRPLRKVLEDNRELIVKAYPKEV
ncbi:MAG: hypothetical protein Kow0081_1450 [Candidatus Dojkabacteria bacterium]